jgi:hypothetical protein
MKTVRIPKWKAVWVALLLTGCPLWAVNGRAAPVTIEAMMILASDDSAPLDRRLDRIEYKLRRIFGFEHYRHFGEGRVTVELPAETTLQLGKGYRLRIDARKADKGRIRTRVEWFKGEQPLLSTSVVLKKGAPAILGGPPHGEGTLIVTLTAK